MKADHEIAALAQAAVATTTVETSARHLVDALDRAGSEIPDWLATVLDCIGPYRFELTAEVEEAQAAVNQPANDEPQV